MARALPMLVVFAAPLLACSAGDAASPPDGSADASLSDVPTSDVLAEVPPTDSAMDAMDAGVEGGLPPTQACMRYFEKLHAKLMACTHVELPAARVADLRVAFQIQCETIGTYPGSGFDRAWMAGCGDAIERAPCDGLRRLWSNEFADLLRNPTPSGFRFGWPAGCELPRGSRAPGAPCAVGAQCDTGMCSGVAGCGACLAVVREGESCSSGPSLPCEDGTACDPATHRCRRFPTTPGERCIHVACGFGLSCEAHVPPQVCFLLKGEGASCDDDYDCAGDLACVGTCKRRVVPLGGTCGDEVCALGLFCVDGICLAPAFPRNGESCTSSLSTGTASGVGPCGEGACSCVGYSEEGWCTGGHRCAADSATGCAGDRDCASTPLDCH